MIPYPRVSIEEEEEEEKNLSRVFYPSSTANERRNSKNGIHRANGNRRDTCVPWARQRRWRNGGGGGKEKGGDGTVEESVVRSRRT